jgi:arylsulfatase
VLDAKDPAAHFPPIEPLRPPAGAPNVLVVLLDDVGFGASSAFGGPCQASTAERLAAGGLRFNRFHTTALCAPTRSALLTGRNHHAVGMGGVTEVATSAPGYSSVRPKAAASLSEILKLNGYSTAQFGKCHEVPVWETSPMGPFDAWPTGRGFEYFYGFLGGETNQYYPALYEGTTPVEPSTTPEQGYHFTEDMTDKAIAWLRQQKALMPDKPFFVYFAPGATHAPHHVPLAWADKYKGRFDQGWDALREEILARQKELGVVPPDTRLTARHEEIPAWEEMPEELKPVLARQMEIYAGFLEHTDHHVGRLIDAIEELGILEDTLVFYIVGDNGASAEGTPNGTFSELIVFNGAAELETPEFMASRIDKFGTPESYNHFAVGWAHAMDTPYQWTKQVASHWGGTRNGTIVHWPSRIADRGGLRSQFTHVIDVAPTVLELAGIPEPATVNGVEQSPYEGTSMAYTFDAPDEPERHDLQYFEMFGNRGVYHQGWSAVTKHRTPWKLAIGTKTIPFDEDVWELYDGSKDYSQAHDLSKEMPDKLRELQELWLVEARKYDVLPLDDRAVERLSPELAGRPSIVKGTRQVFYPGMKRISEMSVLNVKNKSFQVTAQIRVSDANTQGTIVAQGGGAGGGWGLFMHEGAARFAYSLFGINVFVTDADEPLAPGEHQVRAEFAYEGEGFAKGGEVTLYYDGEQIGQGKVAVTQPMIFSATEGLEIGRELGTTVFPGASVESTVFTGEIDWVELSAGEDDHTHLIAPEDHVQLLMSKQ